MPKSNNAFWNFFDKEIVPKLDYPLAVCKKCGQKLKMQQSSTSCARYHLKGVSENSCRIWPWKVLLSTQETVGG